MIYNVFPLTFRQEKQNAGWGCDKKKFQLLHKSPSSLQKNFHKTSLTSHHPTKPPLTSQPPHHHQIWEQGTRADALTVVLHWWSLTVLAQRCLQWSGSCRRSAWLHASGDTSPQWLISQHGNNYLESSFKLINEMNTKESSLGEHRRVFRENLQEVELRVSFFFFAHTHTLNAHLGISHCCEWCQ